jgi:hypothetical protein
MDTRLVQLTLFAAAIMAATPHAQERFSFFQASTPESVEQMLTLAGLRDDDVVLDLGSGDGLIPLTAARMNPRLRGVGVDIDPDLVARSNERTKAEGLSDRVAFFHQNAFDADLRDATVVTMWLFPELMQLLRPIILERARPGTRVLTTTWKLGSWQPDETTGGAYMWIVPARIGGAWQWDLTIEGTQVRYDSLIEQQFQVIEGVARAGDRREVLQDATLRGPAVSFNLEITLNGLGLTKHAFSGQIVGEEIRGTATVTPASRPPLTIPWLATRVDQSGYFAQTGTALFQAPGR